MKVTHTAIHFCRADQLIGTLLPEHSTEMLNSLNILSMLGFGNAVNIRPVANDVAIMYIGDNHHEASPWLHDTVLRGLKDFVASSEVYGHLSILSNQDIFSDTSPNESIILQQYLNWYTLAMPHFQPTDKIITSEDEMDEFSRKFGIKLYRECGTRGLGIRGDDNSPTQRRVEPNAIPQPSDVDSE